MGIASAIGWLPFVLRLCDCIVSHSLLSPVPLHRKLLTTYLQKFNKLLWKKFFVCFLCTIYLYIYIYIYISVDTIVSFFGLFLCIILLYHIISIGHRKKVKERKKERQKRQTMGSVYFLMWSYLFNKMKTSTFKLSSRAYDYLLHYTKDFCVWLFWHCFA